MNLAEFLVGAGRLYVVIGLMSAVLWQLRGMAVISPTVTDLRWQFRLTILPACIFLWPITTWIWIRHIRSESGGQR